MLISLQHQARTASRSKPSLAGRPGGGPAAELDGFAHRRPGARWWNRQEMYTHDTVGRLRGPHRMGRHRPTAKGDLNGFQRRDVLVVDPEGGVAAGPGWGGADARVLAG